MKWCSCGYAVAAVGYWLAIELGGDRWWWATLLMFGPRWLCMAPLLVLLPLAVWRRPKSLWPLSATAAFIALSVMGLRVSWPSGPGRPAEGLRAMTCNVAQARGDLAELDKLIARWRPDVVALQECVPELAPRFLDEPGWHVRREHNLWLASRWPIIDDRIVSDDGELGYWGNIALGCKLRTPWGVAHVINVHLETPREGIDAMLDHGLSGWIAMQRNIARRGKISAAANELAGGAAPTLVMGDFNMPIESAIYRRDWGLFQNAFSRRGLGFGDTKFTRWFGLRIDHLLASDQWRVERCWVANDIGSDHRPVVADFRPRK